MGVQGDEAIIRRAEMILRGRFEPMRVIGKGGMGHVVLAKHLTLGRDVAIKFLPGTLSSDPIARARFLREARACAALNHPNIVTVHDVDEGAGYIVMELVEGESLRTRLRRQGRISPSETRRLGVSTLLALEVAHEAGIVHRDVKPPNILIANDGTVKLADFGVAFFGDAGLTQTGVFIGTPAYMAPEQLRGRDVDNRADLYALGVTLFEAATGIRLHGKDSSVDRPFDLLLEETQDEMLSRTIMRAIQERPDDRFATAEQFREALESRSVDETLLLDVFADPEEAAASKAPATSTKQPPALRTLFILALLFGIAVAVPAVLLIAPQQSAAPKADSAKIAIATFKDNTGIADLDFAEEGLPHLLGTALKRAPGLEIISNYRLRSVIDSETPSSEEYRASAADQGATFFVQGVLTKAKDKVRVVMNLERLGGGRIKRWTSEVSVKEVPGVVFRAASEISRLTVGSDVQSKNLSGDLQFQRLYLLGVDALEQHDLSKALQNLQTAAKLQPNNAEVRYYLAVGLWWGERPIEQTREHIAKAMAGDLEPAQAEFLDGLELLMTRRYAEAIPYYDEAKRVHPSSRDIAYGLYEALFHGGYPKKAVTVYRQLARDFPGFRLGTRHALTYSVAQQDEDFMTWALGYAESMPTQFGAWRARALVGKRDYKAAERWLRRESDREDLNASAAVDISRALVEVAMLSDNLSLARSLLDSRSVRESSFRQEKYAIAYATGVEVAKFRESYLRDVEARRQRRQHWGTDALVRLAALEIPGGDEDMLKKLAEGIEASVQPDHERDPRVELARIGLATTLRRQDVLETRTQHANPEVRHAAQGGSQALQGAHAESGGSYARAAAVSGDGRFKLLHHFMAARSFAEAGMHREVIAQCDLVIHPTLYDWSWGGAVGPCLLLSARAQADLGQLEASRRTAARLLKMRGDAPDDDRLKRGANALRVHRK